MVLLSLLNKRVFNYNRLWDSQSTDCEFVVLPALLVLISLQIIQETLQNNKHTQQGDKDTTSDISFLRSRKQDIKTTRRQEAEVDTSLTKTPRKEKSIFLPPRRQETRSRYFSHQDAKIKELTHFFKPSRSSQETYFCNCKTEWREQQLQTCYHSHDFSLTEQQILLSWPATTFFLLLSHHLQNGRLAREGVRARSREHQVRQRNVCSTLVWWDRSHTFWIMAQQNETFLHEQMHQLPRALCPSLWSTGNTHPSATTTLS